MGSEYFGKYEHVCRTMLLPNFMCVVLVTLTCFWVVNFNMSPRALKAFFLLFSHRSLPANTEKFESSLNVNFTIYFLNAN